MVTRTLRVSQAHRIELGEKVNVKSSIQDMREKAREEDRSLGVAVVQLTSVNEAKTNEQRIFRALKEVERANSERDEKESLTRMVVFPENVWFFRLSNEEKFPDFSKTLELQAQLQTWVDQNSCAVILGSVPIYGAVSKDMLKDRPKENPEEKPVAAMVAFVPGEPWSVLYEKTHLFDVDVRNHKPVRESDYLLAGSQPRVWNYADWKFGCAICYDVRFAELFSIYAYQEVDVILLPSAFLVPTGRAHWDVLLRARAIETQSYLLAPAQSGEHRVSHTKAANEPSILSRKTYGGSAIIDPWGRVLAQAPKESDGDEILYVDIQRDEIVKVREQIPMRAHRKLGLWSGEVG